MRESDTIVLLSVGNTRTRMARVVDAELQPSRVVRNDPLDELLASVEEFFEGARAALVASVRPGVSDAIVERLDPDGQGKVGVVGRDIGVPLDHTLDDPTTVGQDRLLNALAAWDRTGEASVVVDAGTAITVDFVDGAGAFHGGAIAPGLNAMLETMSKRADALPELSLDAERLPAPGDPPFGKTTPQAMTIGAVAAARGMARALIDEYAQFYQAYPRVIATGGDAGLLFEDDPFVERVVPDLTLIGMLSLWKRAREEDAADGDGTDPG